MCERKIVYVCVCLCERERVTVYMFVINSCEKER